jgi:hypothetical protein
MFRQLALCLALLVGSALLTGCGDNAPAPAAAADPTANAQVGAYKAPPVNQTMTNRKGGGKLVRPKGK